MNDFKPTSFVSQSIYKKKKKKQICLRNKDAFNEDYLQTSYFFNPIALRKTKIAYNFGLSECKRVKTVKYVGKL